MDLKIKLTENQLTEINKNKEINLKMLIEIIENNRTEITKLIQMVLIKNP